MNSKLTPLRDADFAAARMDEPLWRIYELCRNGLLPHVRLGRRIKFDPTALEHWIANGGQVLTGDGFEDRS